MNGQHAKLENAVEDQTEKEEQQMERSGLLSGTKENQQLQEVKERDQAKRRRLPEQECAVQAKGKGSDSPEENPAAPGGTIRQKGGKSGDATENGQVHNSIRLQEQDESQRKRKQTGQHHDSGLQPGCFF